MRVLYSLFIALSTPLVLLYIGLRGLRERKYLCRWGERFGYIRPENHRHGLLLHAASIGEVNASIALVKALQAARPDLPVTVTTLTPSGSDRVFHVFGPQVFHAFLPLDLHAAVARFLNRLQPRLLVIMETEIWPNLFFQAQRQEIPLLIVNARLSSVSVRRFRYIPGLIRRALQSVAWAGAQSAADTRRLVSCGMDPQHAQTTGNLKYDLQEPANLHNQATALRSHWGPSRPVLVAGSTHEADEQVVVPAFIELLKTHPDALLVLAPRQPQRCGRAAGYARARGLCVTLHSEIEHCSLESQCLVVDVLGTLMAYYACADMVFVGGTIGAQGGHNVLEPALLGKPVLVGPHTENTTETVQALITCGGALQINDPQELQFALEKILDDDGLCERMGDAGKQLIENNRGALKRTLDVILQLLDD